MRVLFGLAGVSAVAAALLWGCGLLVARPLLPRRYWPALPLIAPYLGFALISAVGHYASAAGASLRSVLWLFIGLAAAGWTWLVFDRRLRRFPRSSAAALVICLLSFLLAAAPLLVVGHLTTIGATVDGISYAVRSEYLQDFPLQLPDIEAGTPYLGWVRAQIGRLRAGDVMLVGVLGLLTGLRSYELLSIVPALFVALMAGSVYVLGRAALGFSRRAALLAAALVGAHNLLLWPVYDNFLSQVVSISFLPLVLAFGVEAQRRPEWRMAALFGVLFSALVSVYPIYALHALAAVLLFWGLAWLLRPRGPRLRALGRASLWWMGALAAAGLWNGFALARAPSELGLLSGALTSSAAQNVGPGNILVFPPVIEVLGLIAHAAAAYGEGWKRVPMPVLTTLGLAFAGLAVYGWWRLGPRARLAAAALLLTGAALAAQQRWGAGYPYGYFKAVSAVVAEVMMLVAAGIAAVWRSRLPARKWIAAGAALLLLGINLKHTLWTQSYVLQDRVVVSRELIGIAQAARTAPRDAWILIDLAPGLHQHWLGYLLKDRKIHYRERLWISHVETPGTSNAFYRYAVVDKQLDGPRRRTVALDEPWYDPASYVRRGDSGRYDLRERRDATLASLRWDLAWPERATLALASSGGALEARLGTEARMRELGPGKPLTVQVRVYSLDPGSRLEIAGLGPPVALGLGGWLLDVDLSCAADGRIGMAHAVGEVILADVQVLGAVTGQAGRCLERAPLRTGAAYLEQEVLDEGRVRLDAVVVRPQSSGENVYRLGFHVIDPRQQKLFGVWSLDFPPGERVRHGSLELDLRDRSSRGALDGRPVDLQVTSLDTGAGSFEADAVWWQVNPVEQLLVEPMLWFERSEDGAVEMKKSVPVARLRVLPAS
ncbi:MAG TPA: hypothetical protein VF756_21020 [Thermoanaerobaculia bacterium]